MTRPRILVLSSLYPAPAEPKAGVFVRERMSRVARHLPLCVVSPRPYFPGQELIRRLRPRYRPPAPTQQVQAGTTVDYPRFFALPGLLRCRDGLAMARAIRPLLTRMRDDFDIIDAHFAYPDGYAATLVGRWLAKPVTITLRGTEVPHARVPCKRRRMIEALTGASRIFSVSASLKQHAESLGIPGEKIQVVGNGVDTHRFYPSDRAAARRRLGIPDEAQVLITVGGLCERKGFHRVIELLPRLRERFPNLHYVVVGGASAEGDWGARLRAQVAALGLGEVVHFTGPLPPEELKAPLSAADCFVLSSRNEGWANVILEAMACGLPVVATDVGGNREVVADERLGRIVPFGDSNALYDALAEALERPWEREAIIAYAAANGWEHRVEQLVSAFNELMVDRIPSSSHACSRRR